jgi:hypothetical protein
MATKNTRNTRVLICSTLGGTYVAVNKTHGFKLNLSTDFSEDTSHGDSFKSYLPGLQDFKGTLDAWYDTVYSTLEAASKNKISYFFTIYPDFADTLNYYRGQCYFGLDDLDLSLGNTAGFSYTMVIANADIVIVRAGAAI